jgi:hypothetical protein
VYKDGADGSFTLSTEKLIERFVLCERMNHHLNVRGRLAVCFAVKRSEENACPPFSGNIDSELRKVGIHREGETLAFLSPPSTPPFARSSMMQRISDFVVMFSSGNFLAHAHLKSRNSKMLKVMREAIVAIVPRYSNNVLPVPNIAREIVRGQLFGHASKKSLGNGRRLQSIGNRHLVSSGNTGLDDDSARGTLDPSVYHRIAPFNSSSSNGLTDDEVDASDDQSWSS